MSKMPKKPKKRFSWTLIVSLIVLPVLMFAFAGCDKLSGFSGSDTNEGKTSSVDSSGLFPETVNPRVPEKVDGLITENGFLKGPEDSFTFKVNAGDIDQLRITFAIPGEPADFWVKIMAKDGVTLLDDIKLRKGYDIVLLNGGIFHLTIYSKSGEGSWSARYTLESEGSGLETSETDSDPKCTIMKNSATGILENPGESCEIPIKVTDIVEVTFTYPSDTAGFWVEVTGPDGKTIVGDYDLAENNVVILNGKSNGTSDGTGNSGGTFKLVIYSNYGSGNWSATW